MEYPSNHYANYHTTKDQQRYLYYEKNVEFVDSLGLDGNITRKKQGLGHYAHKADLFPFENAVRIEVEGSDTANILMVEKTEDRPGNIVDKGSSEGSIRGPKYTDADPPKTKL